MVRAYTPHRRKHHSADSEPVLTETANLTIWLDAHSDYITKDGGDAVSQWDDRSGNGNDFTQGTAAQKPLWVDSVLDSRPIIRFNNDWIDMAADITASGGAWTIYYVCKVTGLNGTGGQALWGQHTGAGNTQHFGGPCSTNVLAAGEPFHNERNTLTRSRSDANFNGSFGILTHEEDTILLDNTDGSYGSTSTIDDMKIRRIGNRTFNTAFYFVGDLAEFLFYSAEHGTTEFTAVYDYLVAKYPSA
jgi:hypothetical protein